MRRFNPEKELYKIQHGNRNKIILFVISLLVVGVIGYSFALYQVRYTKRIIYTKVADFNRDINIMAVYIDNTKVDDFPTKNQGKIYDKIVCDNNTDSHVSAYWDYDKWGLVVETTKKAKCNVYFKTSTDTSEANPPELYQGLIPITFDGSGTIKVADTSKEWYNYDKKQWANAVLIDDETNHDKYYNEDGTYKGGTTIPIDDVLQMYVWIPRYKYQLFNTNNESISEQMINIKFEINTKTTGRTKCEIASNGKETCIYDDNGEWYTHPAFTFGDTELTGIWVGKFETGGTSQPIVILPNTRTFYGTTVRTMFNASRNVDTYFASKYSLNTNEIDTHMMKNIEWGAMAYLSHSKYGICESSGKCTEIAMNNNENYLTGYNGTANTWETTEGQKASTTGNIYGIYDTSGGSCEYVMGNMVDVNGAFNPGRSNLESISDEKYYDKYEYNTLRYTFEKGHLGDATREIIKTPGTNRSAWYGHLSVFSYDIYSWFLRGGYLADNDDGIFSFKPTEGQGITGYSFRIVMTAQDGNE